MHDIRVCFSVNPKDKNEPPCGLSFTLGQSEHPIPYEELMKGIGREQIVKILDFAGLAGVISPDEISIITPEEHDKLYCS